MNLYKDRLKASLEASIRAKQALYADVVQLESFGKAVDAVVRSFQSGGRLYVAGNGGSAADAQHLAAEFVSKLARPRAPLPAEALTCDTSALTAIGNDFGFEQVFSRPLMAKGQAGDVFMGITTSGKSPNILKAFEVCREKKITSILLGGRGGGAARELADIAILAPGEETSTIQELHQIIYHSLCGCVEAELFPV